MHSGASAFMLAVHRAARRMAHPEFKPWLFSELGRHLRFDSAMWMRIAAAANGPKMHDYYLDRQRADRITAYLEQELWREDPFMSTACMNGPSRAWAMSLRAVPPGRLRNYLELHEQRNVVCSFEFEPITRSFAGFAMFRRGHDDTFSEDERSFVEFVEPHLRDAWTHNWLREVGALRPDDLFSGFAQAVFTADHVLSASDDHFPAMMRREWPAWEGPYQPAEWTEHLTRRPRARWSGRKVIAYFHKVGEGLVLLRMRRIHALDQLSPRKHEVTLRFARGASQNEVAKQMRLSPSTVNNYLVEIYRDLDVEDKVGLAVLVARLEP